MRILLYTFIQSFKVTILPSEIHMSVRLLGLFFAKPKKISLNLSHFHMYPNIAMTIYTGMLHDQLKLIAIID